MGMGNVRLDLSGLKAAIGDGQFPERKNRTLFKETAMWTLRATNGLVKRSYHYKKLRRIAAALKKMRIGAKITLDRHAL